MKRWILLIPLVLAGAFYCYRDGTDVHAIQVSETKAKTSTIIVPAPARSTATLTAFQRATWIAKSGRAESRGYPERRRDEPVDDYAQRIGVPRTLSVELGSGVSMEMVLIPNGDFEMGAHRPDEPNASRTSNLDSQLIIGIGGSLLISLLIIPLGRAWRLRQRPSFSLRWLLVLIFGMSLISWGSARLMQDPWTAYRRELARYNELPETELRSHYAMISQPFYMSKFKVTQEQANQILNPSWRFPGKLNPAETTASDDAIVFCTALNETVRPEYAHFRLPTESEWEYACRAGTLTTYHSGNSETDLQAVAWYKRNSFDTTHPVGQKMPNTFGLYDMHGNLPEWCVRHIFSCTGPAYDVPVIRGSSWQSEANDCRVTRTESENSKVHECVGLRLVLPCSVGESQKK